MFQQVQGSNGFLPDMIRGNTILKTRVFRGGIVSDAREMGIYWAMRKMPA
jgi:hypothetical protein